MLPRNRWLVLALLSSALFLISVDMTVLYTALPRLTHDLGATVLAEVVKRAGIDPAEVSETILGQVLTAGAGQMLRYGIVGRSGGDFVAGVRARKETPFVQI